MEGLFALGIITIVVLIVIKVFFKSGGVKTKSSVKFFDFKKNDDHYGDHE